MTFEHAAGVDGVPDIGDGELPDPEAARRKGLEHAFACEPVQSQAHGRPGSVQHPDEGELGEPFPCAEFAAQHQFPEREDDPFGL